MLSHPTKKKRLGSCIAKDSLRLLGFLHLLGLLELRACKERPCLAVEMPECGPKKRRCLSRGTVKLCLAAKLRPEGSEARIGVFVRRNGAVPQAPSAGIPQQLGGETASETSGERHCLEA